MLYFLILLIPFLGFMGYMIRKEKGLNKNFHSLVQRLELLVHKLGEEKKVDFSALSDVAIVTNEDIKKAEKKLHTIELMMERRKSPTVANRFAHRLQKLDSLGEYLSRLEKALQQKEKEQLEAGISE